MATYETRARIGSLTLPAKPTERDGFCGDENLRIFGSFVQTYVNKYVGNLWRTIYFDESEPIKTLLSDDPKDGVLDDDLPALYVYRQIYHREPINLAVDLKIIPSQFTCVWIPSKELLFERKIKTGLANAVAKAIYSATERGMDPSFQIEGFEHEQGTFIYQRKLMNVYSIDVSEGKWSKVDMYLSGDRNDEQSTSSFPCLYVNINVQEQYERGVTDDPDLPNDQYDFNNSIEYTVWNDPATPTDVNRRVLNK